MSTELFNTSINRIVEVPDDAVDGYLAQDAYRKVKAADRSLSSIPRDADSVTVSRADYEARVAQAVSEALSGAAQDKDAAVAAAVAKAEVEKNQAVADALAKAAVDAAQPPASA